MRVPLFFLVKVIWKTGSQFLGTQVLLIAGYERELIKTGIFPKQNVLPFFNVNQRHFMSKIMISRAEAFVPVNRQS